MATDAISALGAGSGVDVKSLATSLVDAERAPRKSAIEAKIKKSESGISGYGAIKFVLNDL
jgi:flagellar hook-associated protein 2